MKINCIHIRTFIIILVLGCCTQQSLLGQVFNPWGPPPNDTDVDANLFRKIASHFSAELAIGYGSTRYRQNLDAYKIFSSNDRLTLLTEDSLGNSVGISNWLNNGQMTDTINTEDAILYQSSKNELAQSRPYLIDSLEKRLTGGGAAIPISLKVHFNYDRFRAGAGATFEFNSKAKLSLKGFPNYIGTYESDFKRFFTKKYYVTAGVRYYDFWDLSYYADVEFGSFRVSSSAFPASTVSTSNYWNISLPIEKNLSEYFKIVVRPSVDLKSIHTMMPTGASLKTNMWNVQVQLGVRMSFPLFKRCPIDNCRAQKEHKHIDKKFRGQPLHKWQNPKIGQNDPYNLNEKRSFFHFLNPK